MVRSNTSMYAAGLAAAIATGQAVTSAQAGFAVLGQSGWTAQWDASLDALVDIDFIEVIDNAIFLQKSAEFRDAPVNGSFAPIVINFVQTGPSTISSIVIDDEIIANNSGQSWSGFRMTLSGTANAAFNPQMTSASGGGPPIGFAVDPFTSASFADNNHALNIGGGSLPNDEVWFPGGGPDEGQLWITIQSGSPGDLRTFALSEQPVGATAGPVCEKILAPPGGAPLCDSTGNTLNAMVENATLETTYDWQVVTGPCAIDSGDGTSSILYSIPSDCPDDSCCLFRLTVDDPQDALPPDACERQVCCECPAAGDEGRTPGFWKQSHHFGHWPEPYCPSTGCSCGSATLFCDVFDCANACPAARSAYEGKTLLEVLRQGGGKFKALGRHAVAALLNSAMNDELLDYAFTTQQVIDMVNDAIDDCKSQPAHGTLGDANEEGGGDLGGQSHCTDLDATGAVDQLDLSIILGNWGRSGAGDIDENGIVGVRDLQILLANWGTY